MAAPLAAIFDLSQKTTVFKAGWFQITLANLVAVALVLAVFALGVWIQLPGRTGRDGS